ncbi:hypothetical protein EJB05_46104, partial [Eragrostis curvula]
MDPSQRSFTNLLNQDSPSLYSESSNPSSPPTPQSQFAFPPNFLQNFNPFGAAGYPPYGQSPPRFQGVQQQRGWMPPPTASFQGFQPQDSLGPPYMHFGGAATASQSMLQFGPSGGAQANNSTHASESSSPGPARRKEKQPINIPESSDSSGEEPREEEPKKRSRYNWSEQENRALMSACNASENAPKRDVKALKNHFGDIKRDITKFSGVYGRVRTTWSSGESDDMIMTKAHLMFKSENKEKLFKLQYLWEIVKDLPKWRRITQDGTTNKKRTKVSASGAYTSSSNQETDEESINNDKRPEGQKAAKARLKGKGEGKGAAPSPLGNPASENMILYNQAMSHKTVAARAKRYPVLCRDEEGFKLPSHQVRKFMSILSPGS